MKPNPVIGAVPCPVGGCSLQCGVRKFATRAVSETGRRKAGKFYFDCATHGRFGFDGKPAMQEWVLEKITWANEQEKSAHVAPAASAPASAAPTRPALPKVKAASAPSAPKAPEPPKRKRWWEDL